MKIQAILFALLQAQSVHSSIDETRSEAGPADCTLPCQSHLRRMRPSKMAECLKAHCGGDIVELMRDESDLDAQDKEHDDNDSQGITNACSSRCTRLRFSPRKQDECIVKCGQDKHTGKKSDFGADDGKKSDAPVPDNDNACLTRCTRLRFSRRKQDECIVKCGQDKNTGKKSDFGANDGKTSDAPVPDNGNACLSRCTRLRFSRRKQDECIVKCDQDENSGKRSDFGADDGENNDAPVPGNGNACLSRCTRLRFSRRKQDECIAECDQYAGSRKKSRSDYAEAEKHNGADFAAIA